MIKCKAKENKDFDCEINVKIDGNATKITSELWNILNSIYEAVAEKDEKEAKIVVCGAFLKLMIEKGLEDDLKAIQVASWL